MTEARPPSTPPGHFFLAPCLSFPIFTMAFLPALLPLPSLAPDGQQQGPHLPGSGRGQLPEPSVPGTSTRALPPLPPVPGAVAVAAPPVVMDPPLPLPPGFWVAEHSLQHAGHTCPELSAQALPAWEEEGSR